jgi:hypothetical protein
MTDTPARDIARAEMLVSVEEAFKNLKGDLAIRPIFHQDQGRIEAHIFIAFLAYCLHSLPRRKPGSRSADASMPWRPG